MIESSKNLFNKNLFNKCVAFTDIHLGLKNNNRVHNVDCLHFVEWMIEESKSRAVDTAIFLGDFHHHRHQINVSTLNYSLTVFQLLQDNFDQVFMILGNHDLFYQDKREINSIEFGKKYPNIKLIKEPEVIDNVYFIPWLVSEEWKEIPNKKAKYVFGHLELPNFLMNSKMAMPDKNEINEHHFEKYDLIFSGHFHKRQQKNNIYYIGNCFPHNYADVWEENERGVMFFKWGDMIPEFAYWPDQPKYRSYTMSDLLLGIGNNTNIDGNCYVRIDQDFDLDHSDSNFIRELIMKKFQPREITILPNKKEIVFYDMDGEEIQFENIDSIVSSQIQNIDSEAFDKQLLLLIYSQL